MKWLSKKIGTRREEVRKRIAREAKARPGQWGKFAAAGGLGSLAIGLVFYFGATLIILYGGEQLPWRLGQKVDQDVASRVDFQVYDSAKTLEAKQEARNNTPSRFTLNETGLKDVRAALMNLIQNVQGAESLDKLPGPLRKTWKLTPEIFDQLKKKITEKWRKGVEGQLGRLTDFLSAQRLLSAQEYQAELARPTRILFVVQGGKAVPVKKNACSKVTNAEQTARIGSRARGLLAAPLGELAAGYLTDHLPPILMYDPARTTKAQTEAEAKVPDQYRPYAAKQIIVNAGVIDESEIKLLQKEHRAYLSQPALENERRLYNVGVAAIVLALTAALAGYIVCYEPRIVRNHARGIAMGGLLLLMLILARAMVLAGPQAIPTLPMMVFPVVMTAVILTIAYCQRTSYMITALQGALIVLAAGAGMELLLITLAAGFVAIFSLREIRSRSKLIAVGLEAGLAAGMMTWFVGLWGRQTIGLIARDSLVSLLAGVAVGFVVQGLLPLIEQAFRICTAMRLLEWADPDKPLLKRLSLTAPGTYHHSLLLATLCEAAAEDIGADDLLVRVGAYYHDIGKINKPQYFIENQPAHANVHQKLSSTMSQLVIVAHVKDGLDMAKAYGLPPVLRPFITEHHGTTLMAYFQHQAREKEGKELPEDQFRYPGPKPRSRETAILMLADGAEAACRTLTDPTPVRIEGLVHQMAMKRLMDGQLDESNLTLKELHKIEKALVRSLSAIHHGRVTYPQAAQMPENQSPAKKEVGGKDRLNSD